MAALRIAILVGAGDQFAGWEEKLIGEFASDEQLELVAILVAGVPDRRHGRLFRWLVGIESVFFPASAAASQASISSANVPVIDSHKVEVSTLEDLALDVIVNHSGRAADEKLRAVAGSGIWALDFNFGPRDRRALAGFWEAKRQDAITNVALIGSRADAAPRFIARAGFSTKISASFNSSFLKDKSVPLVVRELRRLAIEGEPPPLDEASINKVPPGQVEFPGFVDITSYSAGLFARLARRLFTVLAEKSGHRPGMWYLLTGAGDFRDSAGYLKFDPSDGVKIIPDGNRYWADPFLVKQDGEDHVFFEDYDYGSGTGCISVGKISIDGFEFLGEALKREYHLSFPYLFRDNGALYMIPETNQSRRVEVWRCEKFPFEWALHATALEGAATADSALVKKDDEWWLFTNLSTDSFGDQCSDLHVFRVDGPSLRELTPHRYNPVVIDSATARNGGRIAAANGKLFRPSQNNSHGCYGYGLNFMAIDELSLTRYSERVIRRIEPDFEPGLIGCHHFDHCGDRWVIDVRRKTGGRA